MGLVYADIELTNLRDEFMVEEGLKKSSDVRTTKVAMLVDSGAIRLTIHEDIKEKLGLKRGIDFNVTLADGTIKTIESVSGVKVKFKDRVCETDAFV